MKSGKHTTIHQTARLELGKRDRMILADVIRHRLMTNDFLHKRYLSHVLPNAVVKITGRLVRQGWLNAFTLIDRQQYFVPGKRLTKLHGLPPSRSRPLGPQSLSSFYATAKYCFSSGLETQLATEAELRSQFPMLVGDSLSGTNVVEVCRPSVALRLIRVDLGGTPDHIHKKCVQDLSSRQTQPAFNELVSQKRFVIVILTASALKQELIQKSLAKRRWPNGMRFQVFVVPELAQFLPIS